MLLLLLVTRNNNNNNATVQEKKTWWELPVFGRVREFFGGGGNFAQSHSQGAGFFPFFPTWGVRGPLGASSLVTEKEKLYSCSSVLLLHGRLVGRRTVFIREDKFEGLYFCRFNPFPSRTPPPPSSSQLHHKK